MSVKIMIDKMKIAQNINQAWKKSLPVLTMEILDDCNQYCKWDRGYLAESSYIHSDFEKGKLIWQTPYARRQYYEIRTAYTDMNEKATWKWADVAKSQLRQKWERQANVLIMQNYGGK